MRRGKTDAHHAEGVVEDRLVEGEALGLAVLGDEGEAGAHALAGAADLERRAVEGDRAAGHGVDAEDGLEELGASGTLQPGDADDLAGPDLEGHAVDVAVADAGQREPHVADGDVDGLVGEVRRQRAADHQAHELGLGQLGGRPGGHVLAVLEDGDRRAELEDLLQPVRDVDDRDAAVGEAPDDGVEELDLVVGQCGRRLVHLDHLGVEADGLGDLDDLLLGDREAADEGPGLEAGDAEAGEQLLGVAAHAAGVDRAEAAEAPRLATEPDVLGDRPLEEQVELLEHRGHTGALRLDRVAERHLLAADDDRAAVGGVDAGEHLHERRLAGAVLADEAMDLTGAQGQVETVQHGVAEEALRHPGRDEGVLDRVARRGCSGARRHCGTRHGLLSSTSQKCYL